MNFQNRHKTGEQLFMLLLVCFTIFVGAYCEKFGHQKVVLGKWIFLLLVLQSIMLWKITQKIMICAFCSHDSSKPAPSTSSELVDDRLPTQEGKQTSQKSVVPVNCWDVTRHWWKMLTATAQYQNQVCAEFCSRRKRQNFNQIHAGK